MSRCELELFMTIALEPVQYLFDYNSKEEDEPLHFRTVRLKLPLPKSNSQDYYFFHCHKTNSKLRVEIQHRKQCVSDLTLNQTILKTYRLIGGVIIRQNSQGKIHMQMLRTCDIRKKINQMDPVERPFNHQQEESTLKPYLVVRTFQQGYPLKTFQSLKLGKTHFIITEISRGLGDQQSMLKKGQILILNDKIERDRQTLEPRQREYQQSSERFQSSMQSLRCRFCFSSQNPENLIAPCKCTGSSEFVHLQCLKQWLQRKYKCIKEQVNGDYIRPQCHMACEVCRRQLPKIVIKNKIKYHMLDIFKKDQPFVSLQEIDKSQWDHLINRYMSTINQKKTLIIGRLQTCEISLAEMSVSREHTEISLNKQGQIIIKDKSSKFGTLLYDGQVQIQISKNIRAVQMENIVFSFKLIYY